LFFCSKSFG